MVGHVRRPRIARAAWGLAAAISTLGCRDRPEVAEIPPGAAEIVRERRVWCDARSAPAEAMLELRIVLPTGRALDSLSLPMVRCPADAHTFPAEPSRCQSADSFEPRAWFNGCVWLTSSSETDGRLHLSLSWSGSDSGECEEHTTVPFQGAFFEALPCGVKLAGQLRKAVPADGSDLSQPVR